MTLAIKWANEFQMVIVYNTDIIASNTKKVAFFEACLASIINSLYKAIPVLFMLFMHNKTFKK